MQTKTAQNNPELSAIQSKSHPPQLTQTRWPSSQSFIRLFQLNLVHVLVCALRNSSKQSLHHHNGWRQQFSSGPCFPVCQNFFLANQNSNSNHNLLSWALVNMRMRSVAFAGGLGSWVPGIWWSGILSVEAFGACSSGMRLQRTQNTWHWECLGISSIYQVTSTKLVSVYAQDHLLFYSASYVHCLHLWPKHMFLFTFEATVNTKKQIF